MTDQSPDTPPRPQYGEYATPEEQRARIRQPAPSAGPAPTPAAAGSPSPVTTNPFAPPAKTAGRVDAQPHPHPVDRIVTFALLAYGLINVVSSIPALVDYAAYTDTIFRLLGVDAKLSDPAAGKPWGFAAAAVLAVGWLITAVVSLWNIRRGRVTWWIPVVGGIVFTFLVGTLMLIPLMSDSAVWSALVGRIP
ncbi:DUF6264 family protein [Microbacterium deminutum]|uniref:DUF805 domain-containing protein n=1 Tax=Microbacterium deminutum TaxID=344164 RepID=A0ABN2QUQ3_9MICO